MRQQERHACRSKYDTQSRGTSHELSLREDAYVTDQLNHCAFLARPRRNHHASQTRETLDPRARGGQEVHGTMVFTRFSLF